MYMHLFNSNIYYVLNDRRVNLVMEGTIDMSATTSGTAEVISTSDKEVVYLISSEKEAELFIVYKSETRAGGSFFPYPNITTFGSPKHDMFKTVDKHNYKHDCLYLALESGGLSDIKLQYLILSSRNRHVHKCDLENVCNTLGIHIELIPLRSNAEHRVEHYGNDFDEQMQRGVG